MIRITLNGKKYKGIYSWEELSLSKFCELAAIPMPEGYESYIIADGKFSSDTIDEYINALSKITDEQLNDAFPAYFRKVIACLSDAPMSLLNQVSDELINKRYEYFFKPFVLSLVYHTPVIHYMGQIKFYTPKTITKFRIDRQTFRLPHSVQILDQVIPLAEEPLITYSEASDLIKGMNIGKDNIKRLALFMAIYCRKKGEQYDEKKALEREELMMKVPMSIVWSVFFYTVRRLPDYTMITRLFGSLPKQIRETVERVRIYHALAVVD
jgi:hypothetical protein